MSFINLQRYPNFSGLGAIVIVFVINFHGIVLRFLAFPNRVFFKEVYYNKTTCI